MVILAGYVFLMLQVLSNPANRFEPWSDAIKPFYYYVNKQSQQSIIDYPFQPWLKLLQQ